MGIWPRNPKKCQKTGKIPKKVAKMAYFGPKNGQIRGQIRGQKWAKSGQMAKSGQIRTEKSQ